MINHADKICPNKELGRSFKTDGTQVIQKFIQVAHVAQKVDEIKQEQEKKRMRDLETWRLESDSKKSEPKLPVISQLKNTRSKELFMEKDNGLFHEDSAFKSDGEIPKIIGIDPGQKNIWCASVYNPQDNLQDCDPKGETTKILNLTRQEYNKGICLYAHRKWLEGKRKKSRKYDEALQEMSDNTLNVFNGELFCTDFRKHRRSQVCILPNNLVSGAFCNSKGSKSLMIPS